MKKNNALVSLGAIFKAAREKQQLTEEDIADELRLDESIILKIERDEYTGENMTVYERGYFRAYARFVKLPLDDIEQYFIDQGMTKARQEVPPAKFNLKENVLRRPKPTRWVTRMVALILIILVISWVYWQRNSNEEKSAPVLSGVSTVSGDIAT